MENLPMKTKEEKLNIFQKIRLEIFKRRSFTMERYNNAPDYIKTDEEVIDKILRYPNRNKEENWLQIPESKLLELLDRKEIEIKRFSLETQVELITKHPTLISPQATLGNEMKFAIMDRLLQIGSNNVISYLTHYDQQEYLRYLKANGRLNSTLPDVLKYLDKANINLIIENNLSLLTCLDEEQQLEYIKNMNKLKPEVQLKVIAKNPNLFQYASYEVQDMVWNRHTDKINEDVNNAVVSLLRENIKNVKYLQTNYKEHSPSIYSKLFENIQNEDIETIKKIFLHSTLFDAKGKLLCKNVNLHGSGGEGYNGIDDYDEFQFDIIHKLSVEQMEQLISIDSNYILPYLANNTINTTNRQYCFENRTYSDASKKRCKELFESMFGHEKLMNLQDAIDIIYETCNKRDEKFISRESINQNGTYGDHHHLRKKAMELEYIPLDQLKVIFNRRIIENNSPEEILEYIKKYSLGQDNSEEFKSLLENAYGPHVREILDSRPSLDVHNINSLEVFDERIIDNFGEAFVHDAISYNIRGFSGFLEIVKDDDKLRNFKTYYNILKNIMGSNVETMQRAISEYYYNEELLQNVKDVELTDTQYSNLISVLCSRNNIYNINTLQELQYYDEIVNETIKKELQKNYELSPKDKKNATMAKGIKKIISEHIFGLNYMQNFTSRNYGDDFVYLTTLYDISSEEQREEIYTDAEKKILQVMDFVNKEWDVTKLSQLADELMKERGIKNPIAIYSTIDKMKEHQMEIFNEPLLTIEKMDEACKQEEGKENPLITKRIREDGIIEYSLEGIDFTFLTHDTSRQPLQNIITYEGQLGNNAICTRWSNRKSKKKY